MKRKLTLAQAVEAAGILFELNTEAKGALAIAARVAIPFPHFKAIFAVVMISGIAFGPETGFMVGAISAFASNFFYSQGPWTPWQITKHCWKRSAAGLWKKRVSKPLRIQKCTSAAWITRSAPSLRRSSIRRRTYHRDREKG